MKKQAKKQKSMNMKRKTLYLKMNRVFIFFNTTYEMKELF